ncbi:glycosyltransferase family 2 protein [bacterium]|nr:glycosyltransferase family 2 protein [bacterium]
MTKLSIVIPVYQNEFNLKPLYEDIKEKFIDKIDFEYEIVMVDDGSTDNSWQVMKELAQIDKNIKLIHLSRNFGAGAATLCGFANSTGDCAILKAADLQDPTELLLQLYDKWKEGYNVIVTLRENREDKSLFSSLYYQLIKKFVFSNMPPNGFDVGLLDRKAINALVSLDEKDSALGMQILWMGFKSTAVKYTRKIRKIGKSQWTFSKKLKLVLDSFYSFSALPITLVTIIGTLSVFASLLWAISLFISKICGNIPVSGYTSIILFILFSFGTIMLTLGILGGYIWRILNTSRKRPLYIIEEKINEND